MPRGTGTGMPAGSPVLSLQAWRILPAKMAEVMEELKAVEVPPLCVSFQQLVPPGSATQAPHAWGWPRRARTWPHSTRTLREGRPVSPCPSQATRRPLLGQRHWAREPRGPGLAAHPAECRGGLMRSRGADVPHPRHSSAGGGRPRLTPQGPCGWPARASFSFRRLGSPGAHGRASGRELAGRPTGVGPATPALPTPGPTARGAPGRLLGPAGLSRPLAGRPGLTPACLPALPGWAARSS